MKPSFAVLVALLLASQPPARADEPPFKSVNELLRSHDKALIRDLTEYVQKHPKADDRDEAYHALFDRAIEHDWFAENEAIAKKYLAEQPNGAVRPLAHIIVTMARAQAGQFQEALAQYKTLMAGVDKADQEEFAASFADQLATAATSAGEFAVTRQVYQVLLEHFGENPDLKRKVMDDLARLDKVGKPAPVIVAREIDGKPFRLSDLKGKYVLVDFWATFAAPCVAELPTIKAAYDTYHARGFDVVSVSLDEKVGPVHDFVRSRKVPWHQIHDATGGGSPADAFGVNNIPASFLIDPQGKVIRLDLRGPALEQALAKLIK
ncbi:MAG TPA: TlpA disulfide reductase family protein [Isosphaeraceae bacterium]|jgi:peroxiredoxin|nr:TlpA disulfide reductase family protein [Isosphaeraceae bacterium]